MTAESKALERKKKVQNKSLRLKILEKRRVRNKSLLSNMKTRKKSFLESLKNTDKDIKSGLSKVTSVIQKLSTKGVLHKKTASRLVSRLSLRVSKLEKI
jgi:small subunit ribosomal protein S20